MVSGMLRLVMKKVGIYLLLALAVVLPLTVRLVRETTVMEQKAVGVIGGNKQKAKMLMSIGAIGGKIETRVILKKEDGQALGDKKIIFTYDAGWNYGEPVMTNSQGVAEFSLPMTEDSNRTGFCNEADYQLNAYFQGDNDYLPVYGKLDFKAGGEALGASEKEFVSTIKEKRVEALPFSPWGSSNGDDGLLAPHGVLYYKTMAGLNYSFLNERSKVTLPDGRVVDKPLIFGMLFFDSGGDQSGYGGGSYATAGHCRWSTVPKYCDPGWQEAYLAKVEEMGDNLNGKIDGVMVSFGYDGEANFVKSDKKCETYLNETYGCNNGKFQSMLRKAIAKHVAVFPDTAVFVQGAPGDPKGAVAGRWGYKLNSFTASSGEWGYKSGWWSDYEAWIKYPEMVKAFESKIGGSGLYRSYWMILNMLNAKPDFISFFKNSNDLGHWKVFEKLDWFMDLLFGTLGKEASSANQVWSVLREVPDGAKKKAEMNPYKCSISGYYGDFSSYLYRRENLTNNKTEALDYNNNMFRGTYRDGESNDFAYDQPFTNRSGEGPLPDPITYQPMKGLIAKTARKNAPDNHLMSFDIDNGWQYAGLRPSESLKYKVYVIYLDRGTDELILEYKDGSGNLKGEIVSKTNTGRWIRKEWMLTDAYFADQLEGMTDIRINDNNDGYEVIHMMQIVGEGEGGGAEVLGDASGDRQVDRADFFIWVSEMVEYRWGSGGGGRRADFNNDNEVNVADFVIWRREAVK